MMREIFEHYGSGLIQLIGGVLIFAIWRSLFTPAGGLYQICLQYLNAICG